MRSPLRAKDTLKTSQRIAREMYSIAMDKEEKTSDRISAAKLLLEIEKNDVVQEDVLIVKFEGIDESFLV